MLISNLSRESQAEPTPLPAARAAKAPPTSKPLPTALPAAASAPAPPAQAQRPIPVPTSVRVEADSVDFRSAPAAAADPSTADVAPPSLSLSQSQLSVSSGSGIDFLMSLPEDGQVEVRIFDASGRTVRLMADGRYGPGDVKLSFNGRDDGGQHPGTPGVYYARVMTRWFSRVEPLDLKL